MSEPTSKVVAEQWDAYPIATDEGPMFILFDVEAAQRDFSASLPYCARVIIPIHAPNHNGGPDDAERERLDAMEDELCTSLEDEGIVCRMVGRITYRGQRELVFQLHDYESFRPTVGRWMAEQSDYDIDVSEHDGWDFFHDCIAPSRETWLWIADRDVIDHLEQSGADPEQPHSLEFVFVGPAPGLRQVADALTESGYTLMPGCDINSGTLVICKSLPLDLGTVFEHSLAHAQLADSYGVQYDGWGTMVEGESV